jgi:hypothetical protein
VESVAILKRGSDEWIAAGLGDNPCVYNLEVEDTHNYFANDILVSNCHKAKSGVSQQGFATQDFISGAQKVLLMTGTLYGGKASTIFFLLYRALASFRSLYSFNEDARFVEHYGLHEIVTTQKKSDRHTYSGGYAYDDPEERVKELPGCNPGLIALLLPHTAFLRLDDLGITLPPCTEIVLPVALDPKMAEVYEGVLKDMYNAAVESARKGGLGALSAWMQVALGWADYLQAEEISVNVKSEGDGGTEKITWNIPEVVLDEAPKVTAVADDIVEQVALDRKSLVFFEQVNRRDPIPMFLKAFEKRGIKAWIMRSNVKPEEREEAYKEAVAEGYDVFLMNGSLVEMGMDLVECKNIYRIQANFSPYKIAQQNARINRIGQDEETRVVYVFYEDTLQENATYLMADKLNAISMFDGEVADGLAAMSSSGDSFMRELQKSVMEKQRMARPASLKTKAEAATPKKPVKKMAPIPEAPVDLFSVPVMWGGKAPWDMTTWDYEDWEKTITGSNPSAFPFVPACYTGGRGPLFHQKAYQFWHEMGWDTPEKEHFKPKDEAEIDEWLVTAAPENVKLVFLNLTLDDTHNLSLKGKIRASLGLPEQAQKQAKKRAPKQAAPATPAVEAVATKPPVAGPAFETMREQTGTPSPEIAPGPSGEVARIMYTIKHHLGMLDISNGEFLGTLTWMGGKEFYGDEKLIAVAEKADLTGKKPGKPWTVTVEV